MNKTQNEIPIYDLYDLWYEPFWMQSWFKMVLFFVIFLVVLSFIYLIYRRFRRRVVVLDPWTEALRKLEAVDVNQFQDSVLHKEFYSVLTDVLKSYFGKRYQMELSSKTDQEVIEALYIKLPELLQHDLITIFQGALVIKFANADVALEQMKKDLSRSKTLVEGTIPQV